MSTVTYSDPDVIRELKRWDHEQIDVSRRPELAPLFGVRGIPCIVVINVTGAIQDRFSDFIPPDRLVGLLTESRFRLPRIAR
jgi:hypothetical protein